MIRIGKYGLEPDAHCWKLGVIATDKNGEEVLRQCTYPTDVGSAMQRLLELRIRDSDPSTFAEIRDEISAFRAELASMFTIKVEVS